MRLGCRYGRAFELTAWLLASSGTAALYCLLAIPVRPPLHGGLPARGEAAGHQLKDALGFRFKVFV